MFFYLIDKTITMSFKHLRELHIEMCFKEEIY